MNQEYQKLQELINNSKKIAILGHNNIDGDCIGACLGFGGVMEKLGKHVEYFTDKTPSILYSFVKGIEKFDTHFNGGDFDTIICIDFYDPADRFAGYHNVSTTYFDDKTKIVLDHHIRTTIFGDLYIGSTQISSSCELVYNILSSIWPQYLDANLASALLLGIITDTGFYNFDKTLEGTFSASANLMKLGANHQQIVEHIARNNTISNLKFQGMLIDRSVVKSGVLYTYFSQDDLDYFQIDEDMAKGALMMLTSLRDIKVILFFRFIDNGLKCSVRSVEDIANIIAGFYGGGGHGKAAAFRINGQNFDPKALDYIVDRVVDYMNN